LREIETGGFMMYGQITRVLLTAAAVASLGLAGAAGTATAGAGSPARLTAVTAYVGNEYDGTVTPIRTATNTAGAAIAVDGSPDAIAITPDGKTAYAAADDTQSDGTADPGTVTPIRTATNTAGPPIPVVAEELSHGSFWINLDNGDGGRVACGGQPVTSGPRAAAR
jgi:DNA-binding beta-propeller fold protein YncE